MLKQMIRIIMLTLTILLSGIKVEQVSAEVVYQNEETQYYAVIDDQAKLLTEEEEEALIDTMWPITSYGHVIFATVKENNRSAADYAEDSFQSYFKNEEGTLLLIDMDNRKIWLYNSGNMSYTITSAYSDTITDNVYSMASKEQYYDCAEEAFSQVNALLEGESIPQPMKYISNALLALILAFFVNYLLMRPLKQRELSAEDQQMETMLNQFKISKVKKKKYHTERILDAYDYSSDSSSGGDGGGSSSSGGGHSF